MRIALVRRRHVQGSVLSVDTCSILLSVWTTRQAKNLGQKWPYARKADLAQSKPYFLPKIFCLSVLIPEDHAREWRGDKKM